MNYQDLVSNSSSSLVEEGMRLIKENHFPNSCFLPDTNPLKKDSVLALSEHFNGRTQLEIDDLKTYIASSCIMHCFDGWVYLSHAIDSFLKGDNGIAIHLAYYSELRASLSFLARQGISINNFDHVIIHNSEIIKCNKTHGTHVASWKLLDAWIRSTNVDHSVLLKYFWVANTNLSNWVDIIPHPITSSVAGQFTLEWLKEWSFDIQSYEKDKMSRNKVSYRPQRLLDTSHISFNQKISGIVNIWKFIEPSGSDRFAMIDRYIFKILFEKIHSCIAIGQPDITLSQLIESTFQRSGRTTDSVLAQIVASGQNHKILEYSKNQTIEEASGQLTPLAIISRALLMLRISSGAVTDLFNSAGVSRSEIEFYLNPLGVESGHWRDEVPENFETLWEEIGESITVIEELLDDDNITLNEVYSSYSSEFNIFKQISRACFWGVC